MNFIGRLIFCCFIFSIVAGCATPTSRYKTESEQAFERIRASNVATLFPTETIDFFQTVNQGDLEFVKGDVSAADVYYNLALGKAEILESLHLEELKRREAVARREQELKRQAEAEIKRQRALEKERAMEAAAIEAARLRKIEAEKIESRRKFEKAKHEKEVQPVVRHIVKRGQTLPQIAAQPEVYGDSSLWPLIYKANRDQISDPAVLWPGQILRIPRNFNKDDINEARRFSTGRLRR